MVDVIYGAFGVLALIVGGLWRLHHSQIAMEARLSKLESADQMLQQKVESIQENYNKIADRVDQIERTLHEVDKKVGALDAKFDQVIELLKNR